MSVGFLPILFSAVVRRYAQVVGIASLTQLGFISSSTCLSSLGLSPLKIVLCHSLCPQPSPDINLLLVVTDGLGTRLLIFFHPTCCLHPRQLQYAHSTDSHGLVSGHTSCDRRGDVLYPHSSKCGLCTGSSASPGSSLETQSLALPHIMRAYCRA